MWPHADNPVQGAAPQLDDGFQARGKESAHLTVGSGLVTEGCASSAAEGRLLLAGGLLQQTYIRL